MLKTYYGIVEGGAAGHNAPSIQSGPCDINGPSFEPDVYLNKLLKEQSLTELMDKEQEMVKHIKTLDSDMQTLVYENYNKFISATDTIRKVSWNRQIGRVRELPFYFVYHFGILQ